MESLGVTSPTTSKERTQALRSNRIPTLVASWSASVITPIIEVREAHTTSPVNSSSDDPNPWLYQLTHSRSLPTVNLANTIATRMLSEVSHERIVQFLKVRYGIVSLFIRLSGVGIAILLFVDSEVFTPIALFLAAAAVLCFIILVCFFSLDVFYLLRLNYEFWFMSALNAINWLTVGFVFGDMRSYSTISCWMGSQMSLSFDANYRSFRAATKSIVMSIPSMLLLTIACNYKLIDRAHYFELTFFSFTLDSGHIIMYASTTLSIFMLRKAYLKRYRHTSTFDGIHIIPCVVVKARLHLAQQILRRNRRLGISGLSAGSVDESEEAKPNGDVNIERKPAALMHIQQLRHSRFEEAVIDARRTLVPIGISLRGVYTPAFAGFVVLVGCIGFLLSIYDFVRIMVTAKWSTSDNHSSGSHEVGTWALACSSFFFAMTLSLAQRDLLRVLLLSFDFVFSAAQFIALAICICDLVRWKVRYCVLITSWSCWFHWILLQDAISPPIKAHLMFRRRGAALVMCWILFVLAALAALLVFDRSESGVFADRILWSVPLSDSRVFEQRTREFALQRIVTILGWNTRLLFELSRHCGTDELLFIQGLVEYSSALDTFPSDADNSGNMCRSQLVGACRVAPQMRSTSSFEAEER